MIRLALAPAVQILAFLVFSAISAMVSAAQLSDPDASIGVGDTVLYYGVGPGIVYLLTVLLGAVAAGVENTVRLPRMLAGAFGFPVVALFIEAVYLLVMNETAVGLALTGCRLAGLVLAAGALIPYSLRQTRAGAGVRG
ncbi:hypothetical protein GCM10027440_08650 [Nocardiopsis coralliicola]